MAQRNHKLEREVARLKETLKKSHQELRELERTKPVKPVPNQHAKFNTIKTISENLYEKARLLTEEEFTELCNKVILQEKVVIKKVAGSESFKQWDDLKADKVEEKELLARVDAFVLNRQKEGRHEDEGELAQLVGELR